MNYKISVEDCFDDSGEWSFYSGHRLFLYGLVDVFYCVKNLTVGGVYELQKELFII